MRTPLLLLSTFFLLSCKGQTDRPIGDSGNSRVGGGCETCELMYLGIPGKIRSVDTSAGWREAGTRLVVKGRVFRSDGISPAAGVVLYYWQTDHSGLYSPATGMVKGAERHGHIRGWVRTDEAGRYAIYTVLPGSYPRERIPAHIHMLVKEAGLNEYYIDDVVFDDDILLTGAERKKLEGRGGSGILRVEDSAGVQVGVRNIILGLNVPGHPGNVRSPGLVVGEEQPSFLPYHVWGPDKGSRACPVCKYGKYEGLIFFAGRGMDEAGLSQWAAYLENESRFRSGRFKAYIVVAESFSPGARSWLEAMGKEMGLQHIALTTVPSYDDKASEVDLNKVDPNARNTIVVYSRRVIVRKWKDMEASEESFRKVTGFLSGW